jgi:hypothetical protein
LHIFAPHWYICRIRYFTPISDSSALDANQKVKEHHCALPDPLL